MIFSQMDCGYFLGTYDLKMKEFCVFLVTVLQQQWSISYCVLPAHNERFCCLSNMSLSAKLSSADPLYLHHVVQ